MGRSLADVRRSLTLPGSDSIGKLRSTFGPDERERVELEAKLAATSAQLGFQRLVADVAARFSVLAPDAVDAAIVDSLREAGEALQLDWAVLWRRNPGEAVAVPTHAWVRPSCAWTPEPISVASISSVTNSLAAGDARCFSRVDDLPAADRDVFARCGLRSAAFVPLPATGEEGVLAALAF